MSENRLPNRERMAQCSVPDPRLGQGPPTLGSSIVGVACFALAGLVVTATLVGKDVPPSGMAAYFIDGPIISEGRYSLDLSRPIFVRRDVPICPSEDALANYSSGDTDGCSVLSAKTSAGLIGIVTDGMRQPTFQMQMKTPDGTIRGWVDYNNLTN